MQSMSRIKYDILMGKIHALDKKERDQEFKDYIEGTGDYYDRHDT